MIYYSSMAELEYSLLLTLVEPLGEDPVCMSIVEIGSGLVPPAFDLWVWAAASTSSGSLVSSG